MIRDVALLAMVSLVFACSSSELPPDTSESDEPTLEITLDWIGKNLKKQMIGGAFSSEYSQLRVLMQSDDCTVTIENRTKLRIPSKIIPESLTHFSSTYTVGLSHLYLPTAEGSDTFGEPSVRLIFGTRDGEPRIKYELVKLIYEKKDKSPGPLLLSRDTPYTRSTETKQVPRFSIHVRPEWGYRFQEAFTHAIQLCGGGGKKPPEPF